MFTFEIYNEAKMSRITTLNLGLNKNISLVKLDDRTCQKQGVRVNKYP